MKRRGFIAALLALPVFVRDTAKRAYHRIRFGKSYIISGFHHRKDATVFLHNTSDHDIVLLPEDQTNPDDPNRFALDKPHKILPREYALIDWRHGRPHVVGSGTMNNDDNYNPSNMSTASKFRSRG